MRAVFAIPGDRHRRTGGFVYESALLGALCALGHDVTHLELPDAFPDPDAAAIDETVRRLARVPRDVPILLDGFVPAHVGAGRLGEIAARIVPIIHHPLGLENGLAPDRAAHLLRAEAAALGRAARIIVPSPHTARMLEGRLAVAPGRIRVVPPGFDGQPLPRAPIAPPLILSVGLLAKRKGHDVLLDALARIADLDWRAEIVGATFERRVADELHDQARRLGLSGRAIFAGELDAGALARRFAAARIFALATRYEGYGIVFGEAMQHGLPIVACDTGAVPDTVGDAGTLVPVDDAAAFADALRRLLIDKGAYARDVQAACRRGATLPRWRDAAAMVAATLATLDQIPRGG